MMTQTNRKTCQDGSTPWSSLLVSNFLKCHPITLPGAEKDAALKSLGEYLAAVKELENWCPDTMRSVVRKGNYRRVAELPSFAGHVTCLQGLPSGEIVVGYSDGGLVSWSETNSGKWHPAVLSHDSVFAFDVLPDGRLFAGDESGAVKVYAKDACAEWGLQAHLRMGRSTDFFRFQVTPDGCLFTLARNSLRLWQESSPGNWKSNSLELLNSGILRARVTPDQKMVLIDQSAHVFWFSRDGQGRWEYSQMLSPNLNGIQLREVISSNLVIVASEDFKVNLLMRRGDDPSQCVVHSLAGHTGPINCLSAFSDETVVSGGADHQVIVWKWKGKDTERGERLIGHTGAIRCVQLLPDGRVVSGSCDGTIRLWSKQPDSTWHCEVLNTLRWHEILAKRLSLSPDIDDMLGVRHLQVFPDGRIVSAGAGGRVQVWDGEPTD